MYPEHGRALTVACPVQPAFCDDLSFHRAEVFALRSWNIFFHSTSSFTPPTSPIHPSTQLPHDSIPCVRSPLVIKLLKDAFVETGKIRTALLRLRHQINMQTNI